MLRDGEAQHYVAAKAHMKLTFERIERNPHRRRFASASM